MRDSHDRRSSGGGIERNERYGDIVQGDALAAVEQIRRRAGLDSLRVLGLIFLGRDLRILGRSLCPIASGRG